MIFTSEVSRGSKRGAKMSRIYHNFIRCDDY